MFWSYWKLAHPPFAAQPDSRFFFATVPQDEALAALSYAACSAGEPVLLTGPSGCGKTLLLRTLRRRLPREKYLVAFVPASGDAGPGLLPRVAYHLAHEVVTDSAAAADLILRRLQSAATPGRIVVMLDDWTPQPATERLAELRWLLNLELEERALCVLLAGEELPPAPDWPGWLRQRLLASAAVAPLAPEQVPAYLTHRLLTAGEGEAPAEPGPDADSLAASQAEHARAAERIFTPAAARLIGETTAGVPRLVNRLASLALHVGALERAAEITPAAVARAVARLAETPAAAIANTPYCPVSAGGG